MRSGPGRRPRAFAAPWPFPCCAREADRRHRRRPARTRAVLRQPDRAAADLRRPGGHRDRERAAVHGTGGAHARADAIGRRAARRWARSGRRSARRSTSRPCSPRSSRAPRSSPAWTAASIYEYDEAREEFYLHATDRLPDELVDGAAGHADPQGRGGARAAGGDAASRSRSATSPTSGSYQSRVREILVRLRLSVAAGGAAAARGPPARRARRQPEQRRANSRRR